MIYFIFLIYTLITSGQSALNKIYRKSIDDENMKDCITFFGTLVVEMVFYSVLAGFRLGVNAVTAFYAFMFAVAVAINTLVSMRALENSELVIYSLFSNAGGTIWTAILGLILFNESITISRALGLVLIMATIIIPFVTAKKSKTGGKGIFWCSMMFFTASLPTLVLKFYSQAEGVLGDSILCFYTNVFTIPFILYLLKKKGTVAGTVKAMVTKYKKPVMIAVLSMICTCITTIIYINVVAQIDLIVISIIGKGLGLISLSLFGLFVFKEKISTSKIICIILSVLAVAVTII